jgi:hypothetical protein
MIFCNLNGSVRTYLNIQFCYCLQIGLKIPPLGGQFQHKFGQRVATGVEVAEHALGHYDTGHRTITLPDLAHELS